MALIDVNLRKKGNKWLGISYAKNVELKNEL
jgi:hypothetical protein